MPMFRKDIRSGVTCWRGEPGCQDGHGFILNWLKKLGTPFLADETQFSLARKGNLGESIAFRIARGDGFDGLYVFPANALSPLKPISRPDIDIVWLHLGTDQSQDYAVLQEVKTTGSAGLAYADRLLDDYDKLFAFNTDLSIHTRLQDIKNDLEFRHKLPLKMCARVNLLAGDGPQTSLRLKLIPTLVHTAESNPVEKMVAINTALLGRGWVSGQVHPWAVGLSTLDDRLLRLAMGRS